MIRRFVFPTMIAFVAVCLISPAADDKPADKWVEYPLTYSADWKVLKEISTINPSIVPISNNYVPLPNPKDRDKKGFRCSAGGKMLMLDVDGDGKLEREIKEKEVFIDYKVDYENDKPASLYKLRVWQRSVRRVGKDDYPAWAFQRACFMEGKTPIGNIVLIDDNNNGFYDDWGEDAIIVGNTKQAELLSAVISINKKFYRIKPDMTGTKISVKEYKDPLGKLDMIKGMNFPNQKPEQVVIAGDDNVYFNVPLKDKFMVLPIGEYQLFLGVFSKRIKMRCDRGTKVKVDESDPKKDKDKDAPVQFKWGGPFKLDPVARSERGGALVKIIPPDKYVPPKRESKSLECPFIKMTAPKIIGVAGEEYYAPPEFKGEYDDFVLADPGIMKFDVAISGKDLPKETKPLNKMGYPLVDAWSPVDMSGLIEKVMPWWESYQCPMYDFRGTAVIKVTAKSAIFGDLSYEDEIEVKD